MKRSQMLWTVVALVVMLGGFLLDRATSDDGPAGVTALATTTSSSAPSELSIDDPVIAAPTTTDAPSAPVTRFSDLPTITVDELPVEALAVLDAIDAGGPFEYRQDDSTFQNREGILPDEPAGHYREYTVETPGSPDRGPRRIIGGADGERYWTDDHYDSFFEIEF